MLGTDWKLYGDTLVQLLLKGLVERSVIGCLIAAKSLLCVWEIASRNVISNNCNSMCEPGIIDKLLSGVLTNLSRVKVRRNRPFECLTDFVGLRNLC